MSDIKLNTDTLYSYGEQLMDINRRILEVNLQMKTLYGSVRLVDLGNLIRADHLANFSLSLVGCANYCYGTANEFNSIENKLSQVNPLDFNKPAIAGLEEFLYDVGSAVVTSANSISSSFEDFANKYLTPEQLLEYGKVLLKSALCIAAIVGCVAACVAAPWLIPFAALAILSSLNELAGYVFNDISCIANKDYDKIGTKNFLKDGIVASLGNEWGSAAYFGFEVMATAGGLLCGSVGAAKTIATKSITTTEKVLKAGKIVEKTFTRNLTNAQVAIKTAPKLAYNSACAIKSTIDVSSDFVNKNEQATYDRSTESFLFDIAFKLPV